MRLLMITDSHFRRMMRVPAISSNPLLADSVMRVTYRIDVRHDHWPSDSQLVAGGYSDVLVSLGTNHCKASGDEWATAAVELARVLRHIEDVLPHATLYCVLPPPSLSSRLSARVGLFNTLVRAKATGRAILISPPSTLYDHDGELAPFYSDPREQGDDVPEKNKLHLNELGMKVWFARIETVLTAHSRDRCTIRTKGFS